MKVREVKGRIVFDSRGNPTVECEIRSSRGVVRASVPSGASTGTYEAHELRDGGSAFGGKGVSKAAEHIRFIGKKIVDKEFTQHTLDGYLRTLDGTPSKSVLGANAILAVSMAFCRANALEKNVPLYAHIAELCHTKRLLLPMPFMNVINGGRHANNGLAIQECMIVPSGNTFSEALRRGVETYQALKEVIEKKYGKGSTGVGDEGGFAPRIRTTPEALDLLTDAIDKAGYTKNVHIAMDCAASEFYAKGKYSFDGKKYAPEQMHDVYQDLIKTYSLVSLEDPFEQNDFENFAILTKKAKIQIVGDDLLVTNVRRIQRAVSLNACNALLLKVNQIGTLTEALAAAQVSMRSKWNVMVSHRSGETEDTFIADLSVGLATGQIKTGAPCRSERVAKYNQLLRIEESLGKRAQIASFFQ